MKLLAYCFFAASLFAFSAMAFAGSRAPVIPSYAMTCEQAIAYYEKYKRIYVLAHGKDIVPVYGMKPIREQLYCGGRKFKVHYPVKTLDNPRCYVAAYCQ